MTEHVWKLGARELASRIARGDLTSSEVVAAHIERIESVNPLLNAVVVKRYDEAREEAAELDRKRAAGEALGPLHGVPMTIKECLDFGGLPSTYGVIAHRHDFPGKDDPYVARFRKAGAVILGKTNVAQLLMFVETDNPVYGRTQNPWALDRSPGGSSGGEGAIIAALGSPLGLGTDIGGSSRNPAAACGVVGFKATAGRLPDHGRGSMPIGQLAIQSQLGVLGRKVEDVVLATEIANGGREPGDDGRPLGDPAAVDLSKLVVGYYTDDGVLPACGAAVRAVREAREALQSRGAMVVPFAPPHMMDSLALFHEILAGDGARGMRQFLDGSPQDFRIKRLTTMAATPRPALGLVFKLMRLSKRRKLEALLRSAGRHDTSSHWHAVASLEDYRAKVLAALDRAAPAPIDVLLSPAMALPALRHGATRELGVVGAYSAIYNVLGYPSGVVPFTRVFESEQTITSRSSDLMDRAALETERDSAGLPIGVQVAARPFREHVVFAVMQALEQAALERADRPSADALPALFR
ncbi:MAG TPA: amidase family protein [Polyangiaceae bacterium]|jgi:fatty acid amide hydrolase|nr:amidase family protein [Polyangiaceae bacterium]